MSPRKTQRTLRFAGERTSDTSSARWPRLLVAERELRRRRAAGVVAGFNAQRGGHPLDVEACDEAICGCRRSERGRERLEVARARAFQENPVVVHAGRRTPRRIEALRNWIENQRCGNAPGGIGPCDGPAGGASPDDEPPQPLSRRIVQATAGKSELGRMRTPCTLRCRKECDTVCTGSEAIGRERFCLFSVQIRTCSVGCGAGHAGRITSRRACRAPSAPRVSVTTPRPPRPSRRADHSFVRSGSPSNSTSSIQYSDSPGAVTVM